MFEGLLPRSSEAATNADHHWLLINPFSGPRRYWLENLDGAFAKSEENRIYEALVHGNSTDVVIDAPPLGVVQLRHSTGLSSAGPTRGLGPNLAHPSLLLANEFIECQIDPKNGYLRSVMIARKRGGRLSGMPAIASIDPQSPKKPIYSTIENVRSSIVSNTPLHGEIQSIGDLVIDRKRVAKFDARYRLWRGARSLEIACESKCKTQRRTATKDFGRWYLSGEPPGLIPPPRSMLGCMGREPR